MEQHKYGIFLETDMDFGDTLSKLRTYFQTKSVGNEFKISLVSPRLFKMSLGTEQGVNFRQLSSESRLPSLAIYQLLIKTSFENELVTEFPFLKTSQDATKNIVKFEGHANDVLSAKKKLKERLERLQKKRVCLPRCVVQFLCAQNMERFANEHFLQHSIPVAFKIEGDRDIVLHGLSTNDLNKAEQILKDEIFMEGLTLDEDLKPYACTEEWNTFLIELHNEANKYGTKIQIHREKMTNSDQNKIIIVGHKDTVLSSKRKVEEYLQQKSRVTEVIQVPSVELSQSILGLLEFLGLKDVKVDIHSVANAPKLQLNGSGRNIEKAKSAIKERTENMSHKTVNICSPGAFTYFSGKGKDYFETIRSIFHCFPVLCKNPQGTGDPLTAALPFADSKGRRNDISITGPGKLPTRIIIHFPCFCNENVTENLDKALAECELRNFTSITIFINKDELHYHLDERLIADRLFGRLMKGVDEKQSEIRIITPQKEIYESFKNKAEQMCGMRVGNGSIKINGPVTKVEKAKEKVWDLVNDAVQQKQKERKTKLSTAIQWQYKDRDNYIALSTEDNYKLEFQYLNSQEPVTAHLERGASLSIDFKEMKAVHSEKLAISNEQLLHDFYAFIAVQDKDIFQSALVDFSSVDYEDMIEALGTHDCRTKVKESNILAVLLEIADKEMVQTSTFVSDLLEDHSVRTLYCK
ncbi:Poly [ADP-ribose] polymerase 14 [Acipenser ruthenus]|uniref:Poly [ADP-ribose] polymerase 14 n=1 Tax=Acipenser ruthenus TaxID=7906 RepID=A0A662YRF8_ACIRT|nr:Poly [ADP-ribose] polymerase 14 [Acipenser ruthenus]